jgi:hypothetical protein
MSHDAGDEKPLENPTFLEVLTQSCPDLARVADDPAVLLRLFAALAALPEATRQAMADLLTAGSGPPPAGG